MAIQVSGTSVISDGRLIQNLSGLIIPSGNTANRPSSPSSGLIYHNTETDEFEVYASIVTPASYATQYQGSANGNNAIWSNERINTGSFAVPSGTPSPVFDTAYGIRFKTNEKIISTDGALHRMTYRHVTGYYSGNTTYYDGSASETIVVELPADGSEVSLGASVAFTFLGVSGESQVDQSNTTNQIAMKLEKYTAASTSTGWKKVGAYQYGY